jgi:hypothetical protein
LDSCSVGGLVEKMSLLDLHAEIASGADAGTTPRQQWYDQAIYISSPVFRKQNLDAARRRIEGTKNAVYNAFYLYYELLGANDVSINAAYLQAVELGMLRDSELARERLDVDLSPVAKLRLIQDGYRSALNKKKDPATSRSEIEKRSTALTVDFVLVSHKEPEIETVVHDHAEELDAFVFEFFAQQDQAAAADENATNFRLQLLPVISALVRQRIKDLNSDGCFDGAREFDEVIRERIQQSQRQSSGDSAYIEALADFTFDLNASANTLSPVMAGTSGGSTLEARDR